MQFLAILVLIGTVGAQWNPNTAYDRQAIVHLFEWKWPDIANECERLVLFLFGHVHIYRHKQIKINRV